MATDYDFMRKSNEKEVENYKFDIFKLYLTTREIIIKTYI